MSDARFKLTPEAEAFMARTFANNAARFGDLRMEATDDGGSGEGAGDGDKGGDGKDGDKPDEPKPTETVDFWKRKAREQEKRAKDNVDAAKKYEKLQEEQKTEDQKRLDAESKQQQETENLRIENLRLRAAGTHGVSGEDSEGVAYSDLIAGTDEESIKRSAEALGRLISASQELKTLKEQQEDKDSRRATSGRPQGTYRAGATPPGDPASPVGSAGISEAERRFGKQEAK